MNTVNKLALVTGGTDGIGLEVALQLLQKGSTVIVVGRRPELLERAISLGCEALSADLSGPTGCASLVEAVADRPIDILINNAGTESAFNVNERVDLITTDRAIFLNFNAPIHLIAGMFARLNSRPHACIVNVTSGYAIAPSAQTPVYSATKAALRSFTLALRAQLADTSIKVIEALPPLVDTALTRDLAQPGKMSARTCAMQIVRAIENDRNEANIGQVKSLRLIESLSPAFARHIMLKN
jgi:uncharacterized oxidoreductase